MLSVTNWATIRLRLAPSACRSATSLQRAAPRASCRLATFPQAINRTNRAAPRSSFRKLRRVVTYDIPAGSAKP